MKRSIALSCDLSLARVFVVLFLVELWTWSLMSLQCIQYYRQSLSTPLVTKTMSFFVCPSPPPPSWGSVPPVVDNSVRISNVSIQVDERIFFGTCITWVWNTTTNRRPRSIVVQQQFHDVLVSIETYRYLVDDHCQSRMVSGTLFLVVVVSSC